MICKKCGAELTDTTWYPSLRAKNCQICIECHLKRGTIWRSENRERANTLARRYARKYPEKLIQISRNTRANRRADMIAAYGGKCNHCGIDDPIVLDIDHINNDGGKHRKLGLYGWKLYQLLRRTGYPKDDYQLLCRNCNWRKETMRRRESQCS